MSELCSFKNRAYVLIEVEPGKEGSLTRELESVPTVECLDFVHGEYDFVAVLNGDFKKINETVVTLRRLPYVRKTVTLNAFHLPLT